MVRTQQFSGGRKLSTLVARAQAAGMVHEEVRHDDSTDSLIIKRSADRSFIANRNGFLRNSGLSGFDGWNASKDMRHVATLDACHILELMDRGINPYTDEGWARTVRLLNDGEFKSARVTETVI